MEMLSMEMLSMEIFTQKVTFDFFLDCFVYNKKSGVSPDVSDIILSSCFSHYTPFCSDVQKAQFIPHSENFVDEFLFRKKVFAVCRIAKLVYQLATVSRRRISDPHLCEVEFPVCTHPNADPVTIEPHVDNKVVKHESVIRPHGVCTHHGANLFLMHNLQNRAPRIRKTFFTRDLFLLSFFAQALLLSRFGLIAETYDTHNFT